MRPFDKFKEIDARLAALEAAIDALVKIPSRFPSEPGFGAKIIEGPVQIYETAWQPLTQTIDDAEPIVSATIAPPAAKRRGRPPKPA